MTNNTILSMALAGVTAFVIILLLGNKFINWLASKQLGQVVRQDGPKCHLDKQGTPTMGGVLILSSILMTSIFWCNIYSIYVQVLSLCLILFAFIGGLDDWRKIQKKNSSGLSAKAKLLLQIIAAFILVLIMPIDSNLSIPFTNNYSIDLGLGMFPLAMLVIISSSNAVNLTDGLDGLLIMPLAIIAAGFGVFAYASGNSELVLYIAIIVGASLGFLWFNSYPANVFMGDVGSLSLGAMLGVVAIFVHKELLYIFMGAVFVLEALSVIIQVLSFKFRKKRIFKMAPLHHHFELLGVPETKVVIRFWIVTIVIVCLVLAFNL